MDKWETVRLGDVCDCASSNIAQKDLENNEGMYPIYGASGFIQNVDFYKHDIDYIGVVKDGAGVGRATFLPAKSSVIGTMQAILPKPFVNPKYLFYTVSMMNLARYRTGATIPHIYFKDYREERFLLPPLPIQRQIADVLDRASALIEKRKAQIDKVDLLVKSRFVEMFRNDEWQEKRLDEIATTRLGKMLDEKKKTGKSTYPYIANFNVQWFRLELEKLNTMDFDEADRAEFALQYGDLLVCEGGDVGRTAIWKNDLEDCFFQKAIHRVRCNPDMCVPEYLAWVMYRKATTTNFDGLVTGVTIAHLTGEKLRRLMIPVPPLDLQNDFAMFVRQTDKSKFKMRNELAKLEVLYKALMQKCFRGEIF